MASLDYGMALSRGLIAPQKELQEEIRKLVGDTFKSTDWWNQQLDRQIKDGVTEKKTRTETTYPQGTNRYGQPNQFTGQQNNGGDRLDASYFSPVTKTINYTEQRDLNSNELDAISDQATEGARKAKRDASQAKLPKDRKIRGSGGLMGRATSNKKGLAADLPNLGSVGLGFRNIKLG